MISIDPSIRKCGYAIWNLSGKLVDYGLIKTPQKTMELETRLVVFMEAFREVLDEYYSDYIRHGSIIERAEKYTYSGTGGKPRNNVKSMNVNHNVVGLMAGLLMNKGVPVKFASPDDWKGKQSKEVTRLNVNAIYGLSLTDKEYDISDAIGLGKWHLQNLKMEKMLR